jgi:uncharacterized protein YvpB
LKKTHPHRKGHKKWLLLLIPLTVFVMAAGCFFFFQAQTKAANPSPKKISSVPAKASKASEKKTDSNSQKIISVSHISQKATLPTGCELVSAMMLLSYYGYSTTADEIIRRTPKSILLSDEDAVYGMSPNQAFIGDPRSPDGLGCYAPVVTAVIDSYFWEDGKKEAVNLTGTDLDTLARETVAKGSPVLIWATVGMKGPGQGKSWILADTGRNFQWVAGEHCLLMVGSDSEKYYFNDPLGPSSPVSYPKALVEDRYRSLGKQAVAVRPISHEQA